MNSSIPVLHKDGILNSKEVESNINVSELTDGKVALSLREGGISIVHELTQEGVKHLIGILNKIN